MVRSTHETKYGHFVNLADIFNDLEWENPRRHHQQGHLGSLPWSRATSRIVSNSRIDFASTVSSVPAERLDAVMSNNLPGLRPCEI